MVKAWFYYKLNFKQLAENKYSKVVTVEQDLANITQELLWLLQI